MYKLAQYSDFLSGLYLNHSLQVYMYVLFLSPNDNL